MGCAGVFLMLFPGWLRCSPDAFRTVCEVYRAQLHFKKIIHILSPATSSEFILFLKCVAKCSVLGTKAVLTLRGAKKQCL